MSIQIDAPTLRQQDLKEDACAKSFQSSFGLLGYTKANYREVLFLYFIWMISIVPIHLIAALTPCINKS